MKWNKAIQKIEKALADGAKSVMVSYHIKYDRYGWHHDTVENITEYEWNDQICKAVNTYSDQLTEGTHIIDEVVADYYFG